MQWTWPVRLKKLPLNLIWALFTKLLSIKPTEPVLKEKEEQALSSHLPVFDKIKKELDVPILTDIHSMQNSVLLLPNMLDILQIPAFLCRQTDLLISAAKTGKIINVKKGQFLAPWDMVNVTKENR